MRDRLRCMQAGGLHADQGAAAEHRMFWIWVHSGDWWQRAVLREFGGGGWRENFKMSRRSSKKNKKQKTVFSDEGNLEPRG